MIELELSDIGLPTVKADRPSVGGEGFELDATPSGLRRCQHLFGMGSSPSGGGASAMLAHPRTVFGITNPSVLLTITCIHQRLLAICWIIGIANTAAGGRGDQYASLAVPPTVDRFGGTPMAT